MTTVHALGDATITEFAGSIRGYLIRPGDPDYDAGTRASGTPPIDRHPALIVRCAGIADVLRPFEFARSEGLPVAVRGGGHSIAGFSTCDDGLVVIDLSPMQRRPGRPRRARRAVAQGGATWGDFDHETQAFGLAATGGLVSTTGIGGFTLGGGHRLLLRKHGLTCDNLRLRRRRHRRRHGCVRASADENAELFWALRGGGGNFGVVTSLEYALHPVGPMVFGGAVFYPGESTPPRSAPAGATPCADAPDELTTLLNLTTAPPAPFLPEEVHGSQGRRHGGLLGG